MAFGFGKNEKHDEYEYIELIDTDEEVGEASDSKLVSFDELDEVIVSETQAGIGETVASKTQTGIDKTAVSETQAEFDEDVISLDTEEDFDELEPVMSERKIQKRQEKFEEKRRQEEDRLAQIEREIQETLANVSCEFDIELNSEPAMTQEEIDAKVSELVPSIDENIVDEFRTELEEALNKAESENKNSETEAGEAENLNSEKDSKDSIAPENDEKPALLDYFKQNKKKIVLSAARKTAMFIAMIVLVYTSYTLTKSYLEYQSGDTTYSNIDSMFITSNDESEGDDDSEVAVSSDTIEFTSETSTWTWDYQKLLDYNSDAKGYIKQDSSRIQYPILQTDDNKYYLSHAADKSYNKNGAIFIDCNVEDGLEAQNCVIYGHNMWTDSMFGSLLNYAEKSYYKKNPTLDIYVGEKHYIYYVFSTYTTKATYDSPAYTINFDSDEIYAEWLQDCIDRSTYKTKITELSTDDKIITLSTCTKSDSSKRFIVQLVRGEQCID